jgi:hypothetical protein
MSPWLKAGLIGVVVLILLNLIGLIPCVGCFTWPVEWLAYIAIGALAAYFVPPIREAGKGAGQGALAAVTAAVVGGILKTIIITIQTAATDTAEVLSQIPPETLQQLEDVGLDPSMFTGAGGGAMCGGICCAVGLLIAAALGALGGAIFAAVKAD